MGSGVRRQVGDEVASSAAGSQGGQRGLKGRIWQAAQRGLKGLVDLLVELQF